MNQPTHAVRMINNWDGEENIDTVLSYKKDDAFISYETDKPLLEYVGDEILKVWELK